MSKTPLPDISGLLTLQAIHDLGYQTPRGLRRLIHAGRLPAVKVGNAYRVAPADVRLLQRPGPDSALSPEIRVWVERTVAGAPPLTVEHAAELARRLVAGGGAAA